MALGKEQVLTIGVDLGGTSVRVAAYTPERGILDSVTMRTRLEAGPAAVVDDMCDAIKRLRKEHQNGRKLARIGGRSPRPLELPEGPLHHPPNPTGWDGFPLPAEMQKPLDYPVIL